MKKNLGLFIILSLLISIAYFSEEVVKKDKLNKSKTSKQVFGTGSISEIKTQKIHLYLIDGIWKEKSVSWKLDQELVEEMLKVFSGLSRSSKIKNDKKLDYFVENKTTLEIKSEKGWEKFIIGDVSRVTGGFFVKSDLYEDDILVCYDKSFLDQVYSSELDLDLKKYIRLRGILNLDKDKFIEKDILSYFDITKIEKVLIDNKRNRWFKLDLLENNIHPKKPDQIKLKNLTNVLMDSIKKVKIKKVLDSKRNVLTNLSSEIMIEGNKSVVMKVFSGLNERYGKFLKVENQIFELSLKDNNLFFLNLQDFWNKRIEYSVEYHKLKEISFSLGFDASKYYKFKIPDLKKFKVKSNDNRVSFVSDVHMNFLFNLILNLTEFKQAKYVEVYKPSKVLSQYLYIQLFEKTLGVKIKEDLIEVVDFNSNLKFLYKYNTQQIKTDFLDKIFTVKQK